MKIISSKQFNYDHIEFKALEVDDSIEIRKLHEEWFPHNYPQKFFDRMENNNIIAIGCFYRVKEELLLIGCIISKI